MIRSWWSKAFAACCCLLATLTTSAGCEANSSGPTLTYYCSTSNPLGLVFGRNSLAPRRLSINVIDAMVMNEDGVLAVLTGDDQYVSGVVEFYSAGHLVSKQKLGYSGVDMLGWVGNNLIVSVDDKLLQIDYKTGKMSAIGNADGIKAISSLGKASFVIKETSTSVVVEYKTNQGHRLTWGKYGGCGMWTLVGKYMLAMELSPIYKGSVDTTKSRLWAIDFSSGKQRSFELQTPNNGFCSGRRDSELIIGVSAKHKGLRIMAMDLHSGKQNTLATVKRNGNLSSLVGLTPDRRWLLVITGYASVGPGKLWALNLSSNKQANLLGNVYECNVIHR